MRARIASHAVRALPCYLRIDRCEPWALKRAQITSAQLQPPSCSGRKGPDNLKGIKGISTHLRDSIIKQMPMLRPTHQPD